MKPFVVFSPFGDDAPRIALFGLSTGNWNPSRLQEVGDHNNDLGLYLRINRVAEAYGLSDIAIPSPTDCNTSIRHLSDFSVKIQKEYRTVRLWRGMRVDGVVLPPGSNGAIASADCPSIIVYCPVIKHAILAHAGYKSLLDIHSTNKSSFRTHESIVDSIMDCVSKYSFRSPRVFVTCGISGHHYRLPDAVQVVSRRFGNECVIGDCVDLKKLITRQFYEHRIFDVVTDTLDTFGDQAPDGKFAWHSYRRGQTTDEKAGRNLVLLINR